MFCVQNCNMLWRILIVSCDYQVTTLFHKAHLRLVLLVGIPFQGTGTECGLYLAKMLKYHCWSGTNFLNFVFVFVFILLQYCKSFSTFLLSWIRICILPRQQSLQNDKQISLKNIKQIPVLKELRTKSSISAPSYSKVLLKLRIRSSKQGQCNQIKRLSARCQRKILN